MKIIAFFDRWYNIIFNEEKCVYIYAKHEVEYNVMTKYIGRDVRSLGNNWFKIL
jgi:hypothetical protein